MPTLPERLLLVSLDDDGQPRDPRSALGSALAGAAVTELPLAGRPAHRDDRLQVASAAPTGPGSGSSATSHGFTAAGRAARSPRHLPGPGGSPRGGRRVIMR